MMGASILAELKRRNVLRAGVLYAGAVWALAQGIAQLTPVVGAPEWVARWFLVAAAVGFPFWIAFAWFYELTPQGLKRESEVAPDDSIVRATGRKLDKWIIAVLAIAVVLLITNQFVLDRGASRRAQSADAGAINAVPAKSVAVLPFVNMSGDPKNDYFSDGITEEILNALAQIPNLKVAARTSAFAFKGKEEDLRKVGEVLDVATVLEGSVQRSGDEVRITAQLIDTRSGYHLWSEKYDRKLTSIFAVEDDISKAIADRLRVQWNAANRPLEAQASVDPRAHDLYLRGLTLLAARSLGAAADDFRRAVELDPGYARAWGALAETQVLLPGYFLAPMDGALGQAESAARHALAIDPNTASAYVALGMLRHARWQWTAADSAFRSALAIAPGDAEAVNQYAQYLFAAGQFASALREIKLAMQLDPLAAVPGISRTNILYALHRYEQAAVQAQATVAAHPDFALAHFMAMQVAIYRGRYSEAEAHARRGAALAGENPEDYAQLVRGVADPGQRAAALRIVESAPADAHWELGPTGREKWLALLGANRDALAALEHFAARGEGHGEQFVWEPAFDPIRDDPRFKAVLKKIGLPYRPKDVGPP
jgi:TolB-like protein/Tfp pilus assembly protein PilF